MKEEAACYSRLSFLAREQKELLIAGNVPAMPVNTREQEKQVFALTPIIGRREEILAKLAKMMSVKKIDLKEAAAQAPAELKMAFEEQLSNLVHAAKELSGAQSLSEKLLDNAMKFTQFTLKAVRESAKKKPFMTTVTAEASAPSFVNRIV
jgi:hypothetical protein